MAYNIYHMVRRRYLQAVRLTPWIIVLNLILGNTALLLAQDNQGAGSSLFLPVVSQAQPTDVVRAADGNGQKCYIGTNNAAQVSAQQSWTVNTAARTVTVRTTLAKTFVDNTYGTSAVGWPKGHKFDDLVGSDHLQLALHDAGGAKKLEFKIDYISASKSAPSGYDSLGVTGGEGKMIVGSAGQVLAATTSLDVNFNQFGYVLTTNSPATDANYTPNAQYPNWIYEVWYEATVSLDAFGAAGFGAPDITGVHASPSKTGNNSEPVSETPCPTPPTPTPTPGGPTPTPTTAPPVITGQKCYIGTNNSARVSAQQTWTVNPSARTVTVRTTLAKTFVDNTYGTNIIDWPRDHKFGDLVGSDNLQLALYDASSVKKLEFKIDYISSSNAAPSGYDSLGVTGGEGKMVLGSAASVLGATTSLDVNFNQFGYVLTTNSPATNASYAPNSQYPNWIYEVWYEATVSLDAFGAAGFGAPDITGVHASPSKTGNNSEPVSPTPCPTPPTPTPAPLGSIGDRVWNDFNRNGIQEGGEPGVPNVSVQLKDCSGNVLQTTTTDANGIYRFSNLPAACYTVGVVLPAGYQFSPQDQGGNDNTDSDLNPGTALSAPVNLGPGQNIDNVDAGINQAPATAALGDFVWNDLNANGIQESNEPGIDGIAVELYNCSSGRLAQTTTSGGGRYQFSNLAAGCYRVRFVDIPTTFAPSPADQGGDDTRDSDSINLFSVTPGIFTGETADINLATGENNPTVDQGLYRPATLGDTIFNDTNRNGIQESGEPGVPNVTVTLLSGCSGNTVVRTLTTNANGVYNFSGLVAGQYRIQVSLPAGYQFSPQNQGGNDALDSDVNVANGISDCITLTAGQNDPNWDAGINQPPANTASLGDRVWRDDNSDGVQNAGEPGIPGVTVQLKDCNNNILRTTTTDNNGLYSFTGLAAGCYRVAILRNGFTISPINQGGDDTRDSDVDPTTATTGDINLSPGQNDPTIDVGLFTAPTNTASLGDRVWNDSNRNGVQDGGEPGVPNVLVTLLSGCSGNTVVKTTTTDSNGNYGFTTLAAGQYRVQMSLPSGFQFSPQNQGGNDTLDSDVNVTNGISDCITLTSGQYDPNWDAGINQPPAGNNCIGDFVWVDTNKNGIQDAGESGVAGATINVEDTGGAVIASTTTDATGKYQICNLPTNTTLFIQLVPPAGYTITSENEGGNDAVDSDFSSLNGYTGTFVLPPGTNDFTIDGGLIPTTTSTAALGDRVWNDSNRNGVQDDGEPGVSNVTVTLLSGCSGNTVVATTSTNASGNYGFSGLAAGQYRVQMSLPSGFQFSPQNQGGNDATDSDVNVANGITDCITLAAGQNDPNWDAGINQPGPQVGAIGDFVWKDLNNNGQQDAGESGVPNVTIKLLDGNGNVLQTTTTDSAGAYHFNNLPAGVYAVMFVPPTGHSFTLSNVGNDPTDSDPNTITGTTVPFPLAAGETNDTIDAGLISGVFAKANGFGDVVFLDDNGDGVQNINESGLQGVTVQLISQQGNVLNTKVTGPGGAYDFSNLVAGAQYSLKVTLPSGYSFITPNVGNNDQIDSDIDPQTGQAPGIVIVAGPINGDIDAGLRRH